MCYPLPAAYALPLNMPVAHSFSGEAMGVVREMTSGGPVGISGYEKSNGEVRRVPVGDWLLRVKDM